MFLKRFKPKSGVGETVEFAFLAVILCTLFIQLVCIMQFVFCAQDITRAIVPVGRAVAVCENKAEAQSQALKVAQATILNKNIEADDVRVTVTYCDGSSWEVGNKVLVTLYADIDIFGSDLLSGTYHKNMVVTIENS